MRVGKDSFVILEYSLRLQNGEFVKGEKSPASMNFVVGYGQILPGLEKRLIGLSSGAEAAFTVPAKEAFGEYDENHVHTRSFDEFPEGRGLQAGKWVLATNEASGAQYTYFVKAKGADSVTLDFNHPLAGKDLLYQVRLVHVRPASTEELAYLRPCEHGGGQP